MKALRIVIAIVCLLSSNAYADYYKVYSPKVEEDEASFEADLNYSGDDRKSLDHYMSQVYGVEYGVNRFWSTELSAEIEKSSSLTTRITTIKWENVLVPFKPGEKIVDFGFYLELEKSTQDSSPNNGEARFLLEKRFGDFINTANISFSHNQGPHSVPGTDAGFSWCTKYHVNDLFEPGFEYYSDLGKLDREDGFNRQDNVLGPVIQGHFGEVNYDAGVLFGVTQSAHDVTVKFNLEYGF